MSSSIQPFTDEQARSLINLEQRYQVWMAAEQALAALPYDLRRKEVGGRAYLYEITDRSGNGASLGPWSATQQVRFDAYRQTKSDARTRIATSRPLVDEASRLCRALRTPLLASPAGEILREADRQALLGKMVLLVGANALPAYAIEAGGFILGAPDETQDFDLAWAASEMPDGQPLWRMLKAVDPTYTVNTERPFQARNASAYEVEVLVAPSRLATLTRTDKPRPTPLPEQEWLLNGRPVDRVVACRDGRPARIVAPDPRWFALQKLWMSEKLERNALKKPKDRKQGRALLNTVAEAMPHYPLDEAFEAELPAELAPHFAAWKQDRSA